MSPLLSSLFGWFRYLCPKIVQTCNSAWNCLSKPKPWEVMKCLLAKNVRRGANVLSGMFNVHSVHKGHDLYRVVPRYSFPALFGQNLWQLTIQQTSCAVNRSSSSKFFLLQSFMNIDEMTLKTIKIRVMIVLEKFWKLKFFGVMKF